MTMYADSTYYAVVYRDNKTNEFCHIDFYKYDKWGGTSNSTTDIDSHLYGYEASIYTLKELKDIINTEGLKIMWREGTIIYDHRTIKTNM